MIDPSWRFFATSGCIIPGGPYTWHVFDWDQRRLISVTSPAKALVEDDEPAIEMLKRHIDKLPLDAYKINLTENGELVSVSTDIKDDETQEVYYPPLQEFECLDDTKALLRTDLVEIDRLGPQTDLDFYYSGPGQKRAVVFKYYCINQHIPRRWNEINIYMRLPRNHPNIVPFDHLVLDEVESRVVGFTTLYYPNGTLDGNKHEAFPLSWLKQLVEVVDELNLKLGIVHQDISPRNLVVDPETQAIRLFDFDFACRVGSQDEDGFRNDISGVIFTAYELITRDEHFREVPFTEQKSSDIENMREWTKHPDVHLTHEISEYRQLLNEWATRRRLQQETECYTLPSTYIDFPPMEKPPLKRSLTRHPDGRKEVIVLYPTRFVRHAKELGEYSVSWQRPAQSKMASGEQILANGMPVVGEGL